MRCVLRVLNMEAWQKRYLVLRDSWTDDSDTSLELYACSDTDGSKCHTVNLRHVMFVDVYHDSKSFPHAFIVFRLVTSLLDLTAWNALPHSLSAAPSLPTFRRLLKT